jgi:hypothetical protein
VDLVWGSISVRSWLSWCRATSGSTGIGQFHVVLNQELKFTLVLL